MKVDESLSIPSHYQCHWILLNAVTLALFALVSSETALDRVLLFVVNLLTATGVIFLMNANARVSLQCAAFGLAFAFAVLVQPGMQVRAQPSILVLTSLLHGAWLSILIVYWSRSGIARN